MRLTITSHAYTVGDIIVVQGVVGTVGANNTFRVKTSVDANTIEVQTIPAQGETAVDAIGTGAWSSGGWAFNLTKAAANSTFATDAPAAAGASTDQTLASVTCVKGQYSCTSPITWPSINASTLVSAILFGTTAASDRLVYFTDGKQLVRLTATTTAGTTLNCEPLYAGIPNGTVLNFTNGVAATMSALANAGDTTITVGSVTIQKGHTVDAPITNANLPVTTASGAAGTFTYTVDSNFGLFTI